MEGEDINMPLRYCSTPQCGNLIPIGTSYCHECKPIDNKSAERSRHNSITNATYGSTRWRKLRLIVLNHNPYCAECTRNDCVSAATEVDHIKPHDGDKKLMWDVDNLQGLCHQCHSRKTVKEDGGFGNRKSGAQTSQRAY